MRITQFTGIFAIIIAIVATNSVANIPVSGEWKNELGSHMCIYSRSPYPGQFNGWYNSAVGNATNEYALVGRYDTGGSETGATLGWTVVYRNRYQTAESTATWSGQWQQLQPEKDRILIYTTWLLTVQTTPENNWESTYIGKDTF